MKTIPTLFLTATTALLPLSASTPPPAAPASAAVQEAEEVVPYVRELDSLLRVEHPTPAQTARLAELESPTLAEPASYAAEIAIAKFIWQHCESLKRTAHP